MVAYYCPIYNDDNLDSFIQTIQVGSHVLTFHFQWAIVSEEQYKLIYRYLADKSLNDPLFIDGNYTREYDWYDYYYNLIGKDLESWLDTKPNLPASIIGQTRNTQLMRLKNNITEVESLEPAIRLYGDILRWQFTMTSPGLTTTVGYVQPGGWYHNQNNTLSFRFASSLDTISKSTITAVTIQFEVYDDE